VSKVFDTTDEARRTKEENKVTIGFETARYAFLEDCGHAVLFLTRTGYLGCKATVRYKTRDGTATSVDDYEAVDSVMVFEPGEDRKEMKIKIFDDNAYEENEEFYVDLSEPLVEEEAGACTATLSELNSTIVVIIDDDDPGIIRWQGEDVEIEEEVDGTVAELIVERIGGASGKISCRYETEDMNAFAGADYEYTTGKIEMPPAVQTATVSVPIKSKGRILKTCSFIVRLTEPFGCVFDKDTDGGEESCICHVTIKGKTNETRMNVLKRMESKIVSQKAMLSHRHWRQQFVDALFKVVDDDDDDDGEDDGEDGEKKDDGPSAFDYFMHVISMPWKLLFAFVPPTDYCGGWACFVAALMMIAVVTAIVGDMANLVGCCLKIDPEITAITFVALGTSLPDTFASKTAASMDPYADASIGNVTGSNSVNVFIGLGLSWSIGAFYWASKDAVDPEWADKVVLPTGPYYCIRDTILKHTGDGWSNGDPASGVLPTGGNGSAVFVTPQGTIWFNLLVFSCNALFAIQHLLARRKRWGGELGGPKWGFLGQYMSAAWLCFQWVIYIAASSVWVSTRECDKDCD
jgi:solute carrier family 8 (sodium/calcium exchanger)